MPRTFFTSARLTVISTILLSLLSSAAVHSAQETLAEVLEKEIEIEEITITSQRSLSAVRNQIVRAEDRQYALFNDLVEDQQLQIVCQKIAKTGSHLRKRDCEPRFMKTARIKERFESQPFSNRLGPDFGNGAFHAIDGISNEALTRQQSKRFEQLKDEMIRLGTEHEALGEVIIEAHYLRALELEMRKREYWKNKR